MANQHVSHSEVKAICDKLEIHPGEAKTSDSKYGGKAKLKRSSTAQSPGTSTSDMKEGRGIPGFRGRFAPKAKQE